MTEIRIENTSSHDFTDVRVAGQAFGTIPAGTTSAYQPVSLTLGYAALELAAGGRTLTGQTLSVGADRFTYRIAITDLAAGHLAIDVVRE